MDIIGDTQGFGNKAPITPSRGFSVETLTRITLSWKTESIRVFLPWKIEYPDSCSTVLRHVARKVAAMEGGL